MTGFRLRSLREDEWDEIAQLIFDSTNTWYSTHFDKTVFGGKPMAARVFPEVYELLDPGCCLVAECETTGRKAGSCFYHPRETHVSLGIMNAHPDFYGRGVAGGLLREINARADDLSLPVRLVSSAMNLDSFSVYTRNGFVPRATYQTMTRAVSEEGLGFENPEPDRVRAAVPADAAKMADLELELSGIRRVGDYAHFIENAAGIWHVSVFENESGEIDGFLCSVNHPGSNMLGPGVMRGSEQALALVHAELDAQRGRSPVFLVPVDASQLVWTLYEWGARNCEMHVCQVRGKFTPFKGINMPTFMPETG